MPSCKHPLGTPSPLHRAHSSPISSPWDLAHHILLLCAPRNPKDILRPPNPRVPSPRAPPGHPWQGEQLPCSEERARAAISWMVSARRDLGSISTVSSTLTCWSRQRCHGCGHAACALPPPPQEHCAPAEDSALLSAHPTGHEVSAHMRITGAHTHVCVQRDGHSHYTQGGGYRHTCACVRILTLLHTHIAHTTAVHIHSSTLIGACTYVCTQTGSVFTRAHRDTHTRAVTTHTRVHLLHTYAHSHPHSPPHPAHT